LRGGRKTLGFYPRRQVALERDRKWGAKELQEYEHSFSTTLCMEGKNRIGQLIVEWEEVWGFSFCCFWIFRKGSRLSFLLGDRPKEIGPFDGSETLYAYY